MIGHTEATLTMCGCGITPRLAAVVRDAPHKSHVLLQDAFEAMQLAASDTASPIDIGMVNDEV